MLSLKKLDTVKVWYDQWSAHRIAGTMYTLAMCYMQNFTVTIVGSTSNHLDFCFSEHQLAWFQNRAAQRSSKLVSCDYWAYLFSWILLPELRWSNCNWRKKREVACHHGSQEWRTNLAARASWWAHVSSMGKLANHYFRIPPRCIKVISFMNSAPIRHSSCSICTQTLALVEPRTG